MDYPTRKFTVTLTDETNTVVSTHHVVLGEFETRCVELYGPGSDEVRTLLTRELEPHLAEVVSAVATATWDQMYPNGVSR